MSQVKEFYKKRNIFITGGTGFLGKILIEKLLRSCPEIGTIYLLLRTKKGKNIEVRVNELIADPAFNVLRIQRPDFPNKIVGISGDISLEGLGLSNADHAHIAEEVSVIIHLGATVRFDEKLSVAIRTNVISTKDIVDLAKACKNLKAVVYVSTAYSHCPRKTIDEEIYPSPVSYEDAIKLVDDAENNTRTDEELETITKKTLGKWPNTYAFSKAIAEETVGRFGKDMPFAIFRPSMVTSSLAEPVPGWIDNVFNVHGAMVGIGRGIIHTLQVDGDATVDLVPVDMVCNALITCAWKTAVTERGPSEDVPVYNYVSGAENPVTWKTFYSTCSVYNKIQPVYSAVYYNSVIITKSRWLFVILDFFLHFIPFVLVDCVYKLTGKEPKFYRLYKKMSKLFQHVAYFCIQEWNFRNQRVQNLWKQLNQEDQNIFPFSIRILNWNHLFRDLVTGLRIYVLKEPDELNDPAKRKYYILYIIHNIVRVAFVLFVFWIIRKLFFTLNIYIGNGSVDL